MEKFQRLFHIKDEKTVIQTQRIVKASTNAPTNVRAYDVQTLRKPGEKEYASIRGKFGPLAITDPERTGFQKDPRFSLSPLVREPLALEEEERRAIQELVNAEIEARSEEACEKARLEGFEKGQKQGYDDAFQKFQDENQVRAEHLEEFMKSVDSAKVVIFKANERFLLEMVFKLAKTLFLKEVTVDNEYLVRLAREIVGRTGLYENIRIQIHPEDSATLKLIKEGLETSFGGIKNLKVDLNPDVERGGLLVDTDWNSVDAQISTQILNLHDSWVAEKTAEVAKESNG